MSPTYLIPFIAAQIGCSNGFTEDEIAGMRHLSAEIRSNVSGTARIKLPIERGEVSLLATAQVPSPHQAHFRTVNDPDRIEVFRAFQWNDSPYSKTNAAFVADVATLNWPVQEGDEALVPGRWEFEFGVVDANQQYTSAPLLLDVLLKRDDDLSSGEISISIVYTDGLEDDTNLRAAVDEAKGIWRELYAEMGVDINFDDYAWPGGKLEAPAFGTEEDYIDIFEDTAPRSVNLVISDLIEGVDAEIFGIAGDIPGPLVASPRSAVQISATLAAGRDGVFDAEETRLLAETMAHEAAHYLGLFHPVEGTWDAWDILEDTDECESETECISALGDNLMFPFPVCTGASCTPQDTLTGEQAGVVNRNVAVR